MMEMDKKALPEGWRWVRLSELAILDKTLIPPNSEMAASLIYLSMEHVESGTGKILKSPISKSEDKGNSITYHFTPQHVLYGKLRPYLNKVAAPDFEGRCTTELVPFLPTSMIDRRLLVFTLRRKEIVDAAMRGKTGARMPRADMDELFKEEIPLPPLPEQKRIAAILTERLAAVERARKASEARLEAARALPAAYLREVFESEEAKGWEWLQLEEVASLLPSKSIATNGDAIVTAITSACLTESGFNPNGVKTAKMDSKDVEICRVSRGEVLIARSNTPELVGRVSVFDSNPPDVVASDLTIRIWPNRKCTSEFIGYFMSYLFLTGYWKENAGGASGTMKKITRTQVLSKLVPVPKIDVQNRLTTYLNSKLEGLRGFDKLLNDAHENVMVIPSSLLRQAFSGAL